MNPYHPHAQGQSILAQAVSGMVGESYNAQQTTAAQMPKLDALLDRMQQVRVRTGEAASKAMGLADRLLGSEPSNITGAGQSVKEAVIPPIVLRLEQMVQELLELADSTHHHLNRLQRL